MKQLLWFVLVISALAWVAGCGAQDVLLGTGSVHLLTTSDVLALPGEETVLRARFRVGDLLKGRPGYVVRFYREGELFKVTETDEEGVAAVSFVPPEARDYRFTVEVFPAGLPDDPPRPQELLVACRPADAPLVVVDLDKTVVASGFHTVLVGTPAAAAGSQQVLHRLAEHYTIVYLTHRPDYFGPKSKKWLRDKRYPAGPMLLSTVSGFLAGSGEYKTEMLRELGKKFSRIEIGVGDKLSDVVAYHENGLKSFLIILKIDSEDAEKLEELAEALDKLPGDILVVQRWEEIEQILFEGGENPRGALVRQLREKAASLRRENESG